MKLPTPRPFVALRALILLRNAAVLVPCYIALDWASYVYPLGPFYVTPWNPQPALAVVLVMLGGLGNTLAVLGAIFLADVVVRDAPGGYLVSFLGAVLLAAGYAAIGWILGRRVGDPALRRLRDLAIFCGVVAGGSAVVGLAYMSALHAWDQLAGTNFVRGWLRFWVGDLVGILVTAPLLLAASDAGRRARLAQMVRAPEAWLQATLVAAVVWLMFAVYREQAARLFYMLFIPLIWMSLRWGLPGAIVAATIAQAGVLSGMETGATVVPILELQALVAAFTTTGLFLGVMYDERQQSEDRLRQSLRLAAAGEMAGAIAHEVNQPLTALAVYGESAQRLLERGMDREQMRAILGKMIVEVRRSAEVMRRLRDLFTSGTTRLERVEVAEMMEACRRIAENVIGEAPIALELETAPGLRPLYIDRVQVQVVLRNLMANSVDSLTAARTVNPRIRVAMAPQGDMARITVGDNGPGIAAPTRSRLFQPFVSGKPTGMGMGLAVSRAIAEAHGGSLNAAGSGPAEFHLVLPCLRTD